MNFVTFYNTLLNTKETALTPPFPTTTVHVKKGTVISHYGATEDTIFFINTGIVELSIKSYMTEKVIDFFFENELVSGLTSFLTQTPSDVQLTVLVASELEMINYQDLMQAYETDFNMNKFGRLAMEAAYIRKSNREKMLLTKTAEEIYAAMFHSKPQYIAAIPVNKIAKYLGIHPESLSRIRKKLNS